MDKKLFPAVMTLCVTPLLLAVPAKAEAAGHAISAGNFIRVHPVLSITAVSVVSLLIILLLALLLRQRVQNIRQSSLELQKRLKLYAMAQEYFFEYDYHTETLAASVPGEGEEILVERYRYTEERETGGTGDFWKMIRSQARGVRECHITCLDGAYHWMRVTLETIRDGRGDPVCTVGKISLIDEEKAQEERLRAGALLDGLTGIFNGQACREKISEALAAMNGGETAALLLLDIDHFKTINDTYGHLRGDDALRNLAELLRVNLGPADIFGRFGGDEFLVCLRGDSCGRELEARYTALWNALRKGCLKWNPPITISTGIAVFESGAGYRELFQAADAALYAAKKRGRDCFVVAGERQPPLPAKAGSEQEGGWKKSSQWLMEPRYQTVLRSTRTIAFDYDAETGIQHFSPFISEYLAGNYDGRPLSRVMLDDGVIHADDRELSLRFLARAGKGESGEMTLRLLSASGEYRWFKMILNPCPEAGKRLIVGTLSDVDAEVRQKNILRYRAEYDPVTGIYNKETFFDRTKALLESEPDQKHFVIRFDIDRFKLVNEFYSVSEGDRVLRHVGQVVSQLARPGETYGRFGSDIFCMCLTRSRQEVETLIEHLAQEVNRYPMTFQFVLSMGILEIPHYGGEPISILCDRAVLAQRTVKGNYVNRHAFYNQSMSDALSREHTITGSMRKALENGEFRVWFQPKFDMRSGEMIGAESLVRWTRPDGEIISPGEFIPLFERNGFILPLDEAVWEATCRYIREWLDAGLAVVPISVNVSRLHLNDPRFSEKMVALSEKYRFKPSMLEMEITESAYTEYPQKLYGIMDELQEHGFIFSMDDFGSGYSSLNVLKDIPVNVVKIDLKFLEEARRGADAGRALLEGTIRLVRAMGLPIIAEGVETAEQVKFLLNAGCTGAQGYYYARPMPEEDFRRLLLRPVDPEREGALLS